MFISEEKNQKTFIPGAAHRLLARAGEWEAAEK
jgi:hypothetical protein